MLKRALFLKGLAASAAAFAVSLSLPAELTVVSPAENAEVCLLTEDQMEFISMDAMKRRAKMTDAEWRKELKEETGYNPEKVKFKWRGAKRGAECNVTVRRQSLRTPFRIGFATTKYVRCVRMEPKSSRSMCLRRTISPLVGKSRAGLSACSANRPFRRG